MWAAATELFPQQIGPSIALRVAGQARKLLRDIPVQQLQQGAMVDRNDGNGPQQFSGFQLVTFVLSQRFAPLPEETSLRAVDDILQFRRRNNENIDQLITRFLSTRDRAAAQANFRMSPAGVSWMLMSSLGASSTEWTMLPQQNGGELPNTEQGLDQLTRHIRRMGHVLEHGSCLGAKPPGHQQIRRQLTPSSFLSHVDGCGFSISFSTVDRLGIRTSAAAAGTAASISAILPGSFSTQLHQPCHRRLVGALGHTFFGLDRSRQQQRGV